MKSLFWKYLIVIVALLLTSFLLSGTLFMWRSYTATVQNTQQQLDRKTEKLKESTLRLLYDDSDIVREMYVSTVMQVFDERSNVIICDMDGILLYYVDADGVRKGALEFVDSGILTELRQNGTTDDMIFSCAKVVSYASHYIHLQPGDLIFTGTPSGVALEGGHSKYPWLKPGDSVDVEIEGIGTLHNTMA